MNKKHRNIFLSGGEGRTGGGFRRKKKAVLSVLLAVLLCLGALSGCQKTEKEDTFKVVTSFYPLYIMLMNLTDGVDGVEIANMAEPQTGCLHDYQLRPKDLVSLEGADLFVANGGGMEEFLSDVLDTYPSLTVTYLLDGLHEEDLLP